MFPSAEVERIQQEHAEKIAKAKEVEGMSVRHSQVHVTTNSNMQQYEAELAALEEKEEPPVRQKVNINVRQIPMASAWEHQPVVSASEDADDADEENQIAPHPLPSSHGLGNMPGLLHRSSSEQMYVAMEPAHRTPGNSVVDTPQTPQWPAVLSSAVSEEKEMEMRVTPMALSDDEDEDEEEEQKAVERWTQQEVLQWMLSLEDGRFGRYEGVLRKAVEEYEVSGEVLPDVNLLVIKGWGVKDVNDQRDLRTHIRKLIG